MIAAVMQVRRIHMSDKSTAWMRRMKHINAINGIVGGLQGRHSWSREVV